MIKLINDDVNNIINYKQQNKKCNMSSYEKCGTCFLDISTQHIKYLNKNYLRNNICAYECYISEDVICKYC